MEVAIGSYDQKLYVLDPPQEKISYKIIPLTDWPMHRNNPHRMGEYSNVILSFKKGWNLFSMPLIPNYKPTLENLFKWLPSESYGHYAYWWDGFRYHMICKMSPGCEKDTLELGKAYWIKFYSEQRAFGTHKIFEIR